MVSGSTFPWFLTCTILEIHSHLSSPSTFKLAAVACTYLYLFIVSRNAVDPCTFPRPLHFPLPLGHSDLTL